MTHTEYSAASWPDPAADRHRKLANFRDLGGLPLALGHGEGAEMRRPLGMAIVGGLVFSQALTLYTTPVVYLYMDRARLRWEAFRGRARHVEPATSPVA